MEVSLYCVFVFLLEVSDLATLRFHFNASYYFVSNLPLDPNQIQPSSPFQAFIENRKEGNSRILFLDLVLKARGNELLGPSSLIVGYH